MGHHAASLPGRSARIRRSPQRGSPGRALATPASRAAKPDWGVTQMRATGREGDRGPRPATFRRHRRGMFIMEDRRHRRDGTDRFQARHRTRRARSRGRARVTRHRRQHPHRRGSLAEALMLEGCGRRRRRVELAVVRREHRGARVLWRHRPRNILDAEAAAACGTPRGAVGRRHRTAGRGRLHEGERSRKRSSSRTRRSRTRSSARRSSSSSPSGLPTRPLTAARYGSLRC